MTLARPAETAPRDRGSEPVLAITGLSKTFGPTKALSSVDLTVRAGEVHALLGENGSGKSTLIKVLSGYHVADPGGQILVNGQRLAPGSAGSSGALGCRFVHQDLGLVESSSVADNLSLTGGFPTRFGRISKSRLRRTVELCLAPVGLDLDPDSLVSGLSPAVRTGIAVARALRQEAGTAPVALLVLDEPTATLPEDEVRQLLDIVRAVSASGTGVLYVTHHLDEVFQVADVATVLRDGRKVASTPVRDLTRGELITQLVGSELEEVRQSAEALPPPDKTAAFQVLDISAGALQAFSLHLHPGEVVGVAGLTGSGRETALAAVFGAVPRDGGQVVVDGVVLPPGDCRRAIDAGIAYLPADRAALGGVMEAPAQENLTLPDLRPLWRMVRLDRAAELKQVADWFERLDVRPRSAARQPLSSFSGGNQQKVLLAKWLRCSPRLMLLDEPTQGVDIGAKAEIHRQILQAVGAGATAVVSSADLDELVALCHRVVVLRGGRVVAELSGSDLSVTNVAHMALAAERTPA